MMCWNKKKGGRGGGEFGGYWAANLPLLLAHARHAPPENGGRSEKRKGDGDDDGASFCWSVTTTARRGAIEEKNTQLDRFRVAGFG